MFGGRIARDEFDAMMRCAVALRDFEFAASQGRPAAPSDFDVVFAELSMHAANIRTVVSAEVGPLRDMLSFKGERWWRRAIARFRNFEP